MWSSINSNVQALFVGSDETDDTFTKTGPFGQLSNHNKNSFSQKTGWTCMGINPSSVYAKDITPLLYYTQEVQQDMFYL